MSGLLTATDKLTEARALPNAASLAVDGLDKSGLDEKDQRDAVATVLAAAGRLLTIGLDAVEQVRLGQVAVKS